MTDRELESKMNYLGMERAARKLVIDSKLATAEEVALMPCVEVCEKLLSEYEVVSCESGCITVVKMSDMKTYNSIVKYL